jgi:hypothetical protein
MMETSGHTVDTPDTRIFSPHAVAGLCDTIGRYWYLFKRLTAVSAGRFYRFEHIETYSSGKVVAKSPGPGGKYLNAINPGPFQSFSFLQEGIHRFDRLPPPFADISIAKG